MCTCRRNQIKRNLLLLNNAEQVLITLDRSRKLEFLPADILKELLEIWHQTIVDDVFVQQCDSILQAYELSCLKASEPKHSVDEPIQLDKIVVGREGIGGKQEVNDRDVVGIVCQIALDAVSHRIFS